MSKESVKTASGTSTTRSDLKSSPGKAQAAGPGPSRGPGGAGNDAISNVKAAVASLVAVKNRYNAANDDLQALLKDILELPESKRPPLQEQVLEAMADHSFVLTLAHLNSIISEGQGYNVIQEPMWGPDAPNMVTLKLKTYATVHGSASTQGPAAAAAAKVSCTDDLIPYLSGTLIPFLSARSGELSSLKGKISGAVVHIQAISATQGTVASQTNSALAAKVTETARVSTLVNALKSAADQVSSASPAQLGNKLSALEAALVPNNASGQAQALEEQVTAWYDSLKSTLQQEDNDLGAALAALVKPLESTLVGFKASLAKVRVALEKIPPYTYLSLKLKKLKCDDKQDTWTSGKDEIHVAYLAVGPDGKVKSGCIELGQFDHKDNDEKSPNRELVKWTLATDPTFKKLYMGIVCLFERDGKLDMDDKWNAGVAAAKELIEAGLPNADSMSEAEISDWVDDKKDVIKSKILYSLLKWNEDDLLDIKTFRVFRATSQSLFQPTSRADAEKKIKDAFGPIAPPNLSGFSDQQVIDMAAGMFLDVNTSTRSYLGETYANKPKDPTVGEGSYRVQLVWEYRD